MFKKIFGGLGIVVISFILLITAILLINIFHIAIGNYFEYHVKKEHYIKHCIEGVTYLEFPGVGFTVVKDINNKTIPCNEN